MKKAPLTYTLDDGPDVDLEQDDLRDSQGRRITQEYVDGAVADVHRRAGRGPPATDRFLDPVPSGDLPTPT